MRIEISPIAVRDIEQVEDYYGDRSGYDLVERFLTALDRSITYLTRHRDLGAPVEVSSERLHLCRRMALPSPFDAYMVFYCISPEGIRVLRVLHEARDIDRLI